MNEPCHKCGEYHNRCFELKDLTDEEIKDLYMSMKALDQSNILIRFSRELLKKASEK